MLQFLKFLCRYHSMATVNITNNRLSSNQSMNMRQSTLHGACDMVHSICLVTCYTMFVWWHTARCLFGDMLHEVCLVTRYMTSVWWHATCRSFGDMVWRLFGDMVHDVCLVTCCMTSVWWHETGCLFGDMPHIVCLVKWYTSVWWHAAWRLLGDMLDFIVGLTGRKTSSSLKHQVAHLLL